MLADVGFDAASSLYWAEDKTDTCRKHSRFLTHETQEALVRVTNSSWHVQASSDSRDTQSQSLIVAGKKPSAVFTIMSNANTETSLSETRKQNFPKSKRPEGRADIHVKRADVLYYLEYFIFDDEYHYIY